MTISFLLHLLVLWPAASLYRSGNDSAPLNATLQTITTPRSLPAAPPSPPTPAVAPRQLATATAVVPPILARPTASDGSTVSVTTETPRRSEGQTGDVAAPRAAAARAPSAAAAGDGLDADAVRQYRMALASQARRFKRYPARAVEAGIGGTVEVRVALAADGQPGLVQLVRSSGDGQLDNAAVDMMSRAMPVTALPDALRGRAFVISLPVIFDPANE